MHLILYNLTIVLIKSKLKTIASHFVNSSVVHTCQYVTTGGEYNEHIA